MVEFVSHAEHAKKVDIGVNHLELLERFRQNRELPASLNPHDLDSLVWKGLPLDIVRGGKFPELMNFENIGTSINMSVAVLVKENGKEKTKRLQSNNYSYPLTISSNLHVNAIMGGSIGKRNSDLIEIGSGNALGQSRVSSGLAMAIGVDMGILGDLGSAMLNQARTTPVDMRIMALKAVLLIRQLTMLHSAREGMYELKARRIVVNAALHSVGDVIQQVADHDVVVDVFGMTDNQLSLMGVLTSNWPSQKLVPTNKTSDNDIYSALHIAGDDVLFYTSQGTPVEFAFEGVSMLPEQCWNEIVQLFKMLGGIEDLIEVFSETRGLCPILTHLCRNNRQIIHIGMPYSRTRCYGNLRNRGDNSSFIRTTDLESSTLTLMVDQIMLSASLANVHYLCEALGFLSNEINPTRNAGHQQRMNDILNCYELKSRMSSSESNDYITPWLVRLSRYGRLCSLMLANHVNNVNLDSVDPLIGFFCHIRSHNIITASSYSRIKNPITIRNIAGGVMARKDKQGDFIKLLNWARLTGVVEGTPISGPSILGYQMGRDVDDLFQHFCDWDGDYVATGYIISVEYTTSTQAEYHLPDTFFYRSEYIVPTEGDSERGVSVEPRPNSYSIAQGKGKNDAKSRKSSTNKNGGKVADKGGAGVSTTKTPTANPKGSGGSGTISQTDEGSESLIQIDRTPIRVQRPSEPPIDDCDLWETPTTGSGTSIASASTPVGPSDKASPQPATTITGKSLDFSLITINDAIAEEISYEPGNCGIDALVHMDKKIDSAEALSIFGCLPSDRLYMQASELATIADMYDHDLIVHHSGGEVDIFGSGDRHPLHILQRGMHFIPMRALNKKIQVRAIRMTPDPVPQGVAERLAHKRRIVTNQPGVSAGK